MNRLRIISYLSPSIPAELYEAVARLLAFVFSLRRRTA